MRPFAPFTRAFDSPRGAVGLLILLTTGGLLAFAAVPALAHLLGLTQYELWFSDSYAILAATDAVRAGLDPIASNPLDIFGRRHVYTDWWLAIGRLELTRQDNFYLGLSWVLAFLGTAWLTLRPREPRAALRFALLVLSPPVLLAINRANNDLVIFVVLSLAALLLDRDSTWTWLAALALIAIATGLKFYPAAGAAVFLLLRPTRRLLLACGVAAVVVALVLHDVWPALHRSWFTVPATVYTFGSPILLRDLGYTGTGTPLITCVLLGVVAVWLVRTGRTVGLADERRAFTTRVLFLLGAVILVACFVANVSFGYRLIFALWLAPWLFAEAHDATLPARRRKIAGWTGWLLVTVLWSDGVYCIATNLFVGPMALAQLHRWQLAWRLASQPFTWLLVALLTGWIGEALAAAVRTLTLRSRADHAPAANLR